MLSYSSSSRRIKLIRPLEAEEAVVVVDAEAFRLNEAGSWSRRSCKPKTPCRHLHPLNQRAHTDVTGGGGCWLLTFSLFMPPISSWGIPCLSFWSRWCRLWTLWLKVGLRISYPQVVRSVRKWLYDATIARTRKVSQCCTMSVQSVKQPKERERTNLKHPKEPPWHTVGQRVVKMGISLGRAKPDGTCGGGCEERGRPWQNSI